MWLEEGDELVFHVGSEFREYSTTLSNSAMQILGSLQSLIQHNNEITNICLNISKTKWADPVALLMLGCVAASIRHTCFVVDLGSPNNSKKELKIFRKFLATQGFLKSFLATGIRLRWIGNNYFSVDANSMIERLAQEPVEVNYQNADCIHAKQIPVSHILTQSTLYKQVESLHDEASERSINSIYSDDPHARDVLFQQIRKLLTELVQNVVEHGYDGVTGEPTVGIYVRVRSGKPQTNAEGITWANLLKLERKSTLGLSSFAPNIFSEWIELFVCDAGHGLTYGSDRWDVPDEIHHKKSSTRSLAAVAHKLFVSPISRYSKRGADRTSVTGLMHLGHILRMHGDYLRIYSDKGTWLGGRLPFQPSLVAPSKQSQVTSSFCSGAAFSIYLQPESKPLYPEVEWVIPAGRDLNLIADALRGNEQYSSKLIHFADRRSNQNCEVPNKADLDELFEHVDLPKHIVLRPPRLVRKADLGVWLEVFAGTLSHRTKYSPTALYLVEMSPFQALSFVEFFKVVNVHRTTRLDIFVMSEQWVATCLSARPTSAGRLVINTELASSLFLKAETEYLNASDVAILLRNADSELFWDASDGKLDDVLLDAEVLWPSSTGQTYKLDRYLDVGQALVDEARYKAARRALRRCFELFPDYLPAATDDLISSLVNDAAQRIFRYSKSATTKRYEKGLVAVGSISVSGETMKRFRAKPTVGNFPEIFLLVHENFQEILGNDSSANVGNASKEEVPVGPIRALLWGPPARSELSSEEAIPSRNWTRIRNTPYIAPDGERYVSAIRYNQNEDQKSSWYGRTPDEMYLDFARSRNLRLGHWRYGNRHDLLTINMERAFSTSILELDSLYRWLVDLFNETFKPLRGAGGQARASVLLYPSHRITDRIVSYISEAPEFKDCLPECGIFPIKFIGSKTISPNLVSPLTEDRIKKATSSKNFWRAALFDDGTISGKTFSELSQIAKAVGAHDIFTMAIVDRSGSQIRDAGMPAFITKNRRYWRLDIPALGHRKDCPICHALIIASNFANSTRSGHHRNRLKQWQSDWSVVDVLDGWRHKGVAAQTFQKPERVKFGLHRGNFQHIDAPDSTTLASVFVELSRLTTRVDKAFERAQKLRNTYPVAALELLITQLIYFHDELDYSQRKERTALLFEVLYEHDVSSSLTAMAALCLCLIDDDLYEDIWTSCIQPLMASVPIGNVDAAIVAGIILNRRETFSETQYRPKNDCSDLELKNFFLLVRSVELKNAISVLVTILGSQSSWHKSQFRADLISLQNRDSLSNEVETKIVLRRIGVELMRMKLAFEKLQLYGSTLAADALQGIESILLSLSKFIANHEMLKVGAVNFAALISYANEANKFVFVGKNSPLNLIHSLYVTLRKDDYKSEFFGNVRAAVADKLSEIFDSNSEARRKFSGRSLHQCADLSVYGRSADMYFDVYVKEAICDALINVVYSEGEIFCPRSWLTSGDQGARKADMWWDIKIEEKFCLFKTANSSSRSEISLKYTPALARIEELGGSFEISIEIDDVKSVRQNRIVVFSLRIPLRSHFYPKELLL